ncbi:MAG: hypothetical protein PHR28_11875 [candidate division Zixibacteria bacterium]|nr:hypothetical protein [candidate division Zixibacteria bacterium]
MKRRESRMDRDNPLEKLFAGQRARPAQQANPSSFVFTSETDTLNVIDAVDSRKSVGVLAIPRGPMETIPLFSEPEVAPCPIPQAEYGDGAGEVFRSDLITIDTPVVRIPDQIVDTCTFIQTKYPGKEFSILCKGEWDAQGWRVSKAFVIPRQKVAAASVYYQPDELQRLKMEGWNTVIHSHPAGVQKFSYGDMSNINYHFPASILFCGGKFTDSTLSIMVDEMVKVVIRPTITIERESTITIAQETLDAQIEVEAPVYTNYSRYSQYGQTQRQIDQYTRARRKNGKSVVDEDLNDVFDDPFGVWGGFY